MLFIHETFLVYKLETFKNCKEVKHNMIIIIAIRYIFYILCDTWSIVQNYFQKILSPRPWKNPPFLLTPPLKIQKMQVPPFCQHWKFFSPPPSERGEDTLLCLLTDIKIAWINPCSEDIYASKTLHGILVSWNSSCIQKVMIIECSV